MFQEQILDFIKKRHVLLVLFCLCFSNNNQFSSIRFYQLCVWGYCSTIFVLDFSFQKENGLLSLLSSPSKKCHHLLPYYLCVRDYSNFELQILRNGEGGEGGQTFRWKRVTAKFETLRWRYISVWSLRDVAVYFFYGTYRIDFFEIIMARTGEKFLGTCGD